MTAGLIKLLGQLKDFVHTITFDNGREFSGHRDVAKALECETFLARPYHSWERGANENANGLLRQYFPKEMSLLSGYIIYIPTADVLIKIIGKIKHITHISNITHILQADITIKYFVLGSYIKRITSIKTMA